MEPVDKKWRIVPLQNIVGGIIVSFIVILGLRVTWPIMDFLINTLNWSSTVNPMTYYAAIFIWFFMCVFLCGILPWMVFFAKDKKEDKKKMNPFEEMAKAIQLRRGP